MIMGRVDGARRKFGLIGMFLLGMTVSYVSFSYRGVQQTNTVQREIPSSDSLHKEISSSNNVQAAAVSTLIENPVGSNSLTDKITQLSKARAALSMEIYDRVTIVCWVMTSLGGKDRQDAILETWGRRCQHLYFMVGGGTEQNGSVEVVLKPGRATLVRLPVNDSYDHLWHKTKEGFKHVYQKHLLTPAAGVAPIDWYLKVDDDSFVVMENMRIFLMEKNISAPFYYGCKYTGGGGYHSGGPGYVMSRVILDKLVQTGLAPSSSCDKSTVGYEDINMARCLDTLGVGRGDTVDPHARLRWFPFEPLQMVDRKLLPSRYNWWWGYTAYQVKEGLECCSDNAISFHYITPSLMRTMEYLIYYLPFAASRDLQLSYNTSAPVPTVSV